MLHDAKQEAEIEPEEGPSYILKLHSAVASVQQQGLRGSIIFPKQHRHLETKL